MKCHELFYPSRRRESMIHAVICEPETDTPAGILQVVHGVSEHIGRYRNLAERITSAGYVFCAEDHLGHGKTVSVRGWFDESDGWRKVCSDTAALGHLVKRRYPGVDFFMLGHSMGSFIVRTIISDDYEEPDGVILSGTGDMPQPLLFAGRAVAASEKLRFCSSRCESDIIDALIFESYNRKFPGAGKCAWISSDKEEVRKYLSDPMCGFKISAGLAYDMLGGISHAVRKSVIASCPEKSVPVLFVSGRDDPVGDMGKGVIRSALKFMEAGFSDVRVILYSGSRHEILHDKCSEKATSDILNWMQSIGRRRTAQKRI